MKKKNKLVAVLVKTISESVPKCVNKDQVSKLEDSVFQLFRAGFLDSGTAADLQNLIITQYELLENM